VIAPKTSQIIGIDVIRFFAASIVMLFHLCYWIWAGGPIATTPAAARAAIQFPELAFFRYGVVGVDIFFVVSGFIIAYSASKATAYEFVRSRIVRLMPAIWIVAPITLAALFAVEFASPLKLIGMFVRSVLLLPIGPWVDGVYWTLPIEIAFYVVVFALLCFDRFIWIGPVMAGIGLASSAYAIAASSGFDFTPHIDTIADYKIERLKELFLIEHGCFFALGVFLWLSLFDRLSFTRCVLIACFGIGCLAGIRSVGQCIIWTSAVLSIALSVRFNSFIGANSKVAFLARVIGLTTYPLYLLHNIIGAALIGYLVRSGLNQYAALLFTIAAVVSLSAAIAVVFEPIAQRRLRTKIDHIRASFVFAPHSKASRS
jgi:peptidoglycan/LPS O-acetylase OafA/YrhL